MKLKLILIFLELFILNNYSYASLFRDNNTITQVNAKDHPSVGMIYSNQLRRDKFPCSGVLVSPDLVLTAFHCINVYGQLATEIEFEVHTGEASFATPLVYATGYREPRTMTNKLSIDQVFSVQAEDLVLLKLERPIVTVKPTVLFDFKECSYEKADLESVGFPEKGKTNTPQKYQSKLRYLGGVYSLLHMKGVVLPGMSGGGVFISCPESGPKLVGINGMSIGEQNLLAISPLFFDEIKNEILKSQKKFNIVKTFDQNIERPLLKNQIAMRVDDLDKSQVVNWVLSLSDGVEIVCSYKNDQELQEIVDSSQSLSAKSRLHLSVCLSSLEKNLIDPYLFHEEEKVRSRTIDLIRHYRKNNPLVIDSLIRSLHNDSESSIRAQAFKALLEFRTNKDDLVIDALVKAALKEEDLRVQLYIASMEDKNLKIKLMEFNVFKKE